MIQVDMQAGKNGQTLHVGSIKEVGIVVLQKIIHSIADFVLYRAGEKTVSEIRAPMTADSISFLLKSIVRLFEA